MIEPKIEKLNLLLYLSTIIFGKNIKINSLSISDRKSGVEDFSEQIDMIASIGKKAIIITVPNPSNPKNRTPYIVRRWKKQKSQFSSNKGEVVYIDQDHSTWIYRDDFVGRSLAYFDDAKQYQFDMNQY